jgi:hypothetical protein
MNISGGRSREVPGMTKPGGRIQVPAASVWTLAMDTFAKASAVAAAATGEEELRQGTASALCGAFADWVFVDLIGRGQPRRAVADCAGDTALSGVLARMQLGAAPLIRWAVQRQTPVIEAPVGNQWLLGSLPDGDPVAGAVGAYSAASARSWPTETPGARSPSSGAWPGRGSGSSSLVSYPTSRIRLASRPSDCGVVSRLRSISNR